MNRLLSIRSYYRHLVAEGARAQPEPTAAFPIKRDKLLPRRPFSDEEIADLYAACDLDRDRLVFMFLFGSGCRRDEVARMRVEDIDWKRSRIVVHGKGSRERFVSPGPSVMAALVEYVAKRGRRQGSVFEMSGHAIYQMMKRRARNAGVVGAHPHRARVTFAVRFLRHYGNIVALKQLMGHEHIATTEVYASFGIADVALEMQAALDLGAELTA